MLRRLLWLVPVALLFWNLGYAGFWNPDEGRYVAASYEMAHPFAGASDWLVPHLNTVARLNKPPLIYWATAASFRAFGVSEWSARLVPALASLLVMVLLAIWGARVWNARTGWAGAMVWAGGIGAVAMGRTANTDMLLCAAIALTMFGVFWASELEGKKRLLMGAVAGVGMAMALLSKGPVGVALPLLFAAVYLTIVGGWKRAPWGALALALGVALLLGAPWFLLVEAQRPGFLHTFIFEENLGRFSGKQDYHHPTSPLYYVPVIILGLMPWTGFLIPGLAFWNRRALNKSSDRSWRAQMFLVVWALVLIAFFSVSKTKLISYALPALPAFSLLAGVAVARWDILGKGWKRAIIGINLCLNFALIVALIAIPSRDKISKTWGFKPGVLLDDHIIPRTIGEPWTWALVGLLTIFCGAIIWAARRDGRAMLAVQSAGTCAIVVTILSLAGTIANYENSGVMARNLATLLQPGDRVASYRAFVPATIPYIKRPMHFFEFDNSSGLNDADVAASPYYSVEKSDGPLRQWLKNPGRVFVITEHLRTGDTSLEKQFYVWGRNNDEWLLSNQPRPAGLNIPLDFTAPDRGKKTLLEQPPQPKR